VHVDVGTGDGSYVYRAARAHPDRLFLGIDANGEAMADRSRRACAKAARGGAPNALFVRAAIESLPEELGGLAARVTVLFPWGSLLRAVAAPDHQALVALRELCRAGARLDIAMALPVERERSSFAKAGLGDITEAHLRGDLPRSYASAGFEVEVHERAAEIVEAFPTAWARRLSLEPHRRFFAITGARRS